MLFVVVPTKSLFYMTEREKKRKQKLLTLEHGKSVCCHEPPKPEYVRSNAYQTIAIYKWNSRKEKITSYTHTHNALTTWELHGQNNGFDSIEFNGNICIGQSDSESVNEFYLWSHVTVSGSKCTLEFSDGNSQRSFSPLCTMNYNFSIHLRVQLRVFYTFMYPLAETPFWPISNWPILLYRSLFQMSFKSKITTVKVNCCRK